MDWTTRECATQGHITFRPDDEIQAEHLRVMTPRGEAWKCLRCGVYQIGEPYAHGNVDDAPIVWHGEQVRDRFIIRLLAVERAGRGVLVLLVAWIVFAIRGSQDSIEDRLNQMLPVFKAVKEATGWDYLDSQVLHLINTAIKTTPHTLSLIGLGLASYGVLQIVEGGGLWYVHRWAEYLAVIATSAFIPIEIYEIHHSVTALKVGALVLNVSAVLWLLWRKHLFGVNGGSRAIEDEWVRGRAAIARAIRLPEE